MFRLSLKDDVRVTVKCGVTNKLLSQIITSGYSRIQDVSRDAIRSIPFYSGKSIKVHIKNISKETSKDYEIKVNKNSDAIV